MRSGGGSRFCSFFSARDSCLAHPCAGSSGVFEETGSLSTIRNNHTATLLPNGKVLAAGTGGEKRIARELDPYRERDLGDDGQPRRPMLAFHGDAAAQR